MHYNDKNLNLATNWQFTKYGIVSENQTNLVNVECGIGLLYNYKVGQHFVHEIIAPPFSERETMANAWCEKQTTKQHHCDNPVDPPG